MTYRGCRETGKNAKGREVKRMAKKKDRFPGQLFVAKEQDKDSEWYTADDSAESVAVMHDEREVGIYALVRVAKVRNKTEVV